jgi:hypothetical protein
MSNDSSDALEAIRAEFKQAEFKQAAWRVVLQRDQLSATVQAIRIVLQAPGGVDLVEHAKSVQAELEQLRSANRRETS